MCYWAEKKRFSKEKTMNQIFIHSRSKLQGLNSEIEKTFTYVRKLIKISKISNNYLFTHSKIWSFNRTELLLLSQSFLFWWPKRLIACGFFHGIMECSVSLNRILDTGNIGKSRKEFTTCMLALFVNRETRTKGFSPRWACTVVCEFPKDTFFPVYNDRQNPFGTTTIYYPEKCLQEIHGGRYPV